MEDQQNTTNRDDASVRYERTKLIISGINIAIYIVVPLVFLVSGGSAWARDAISEWFIDSVVLGAVIYACIALLVMEVVTLPIDYYSGHVLEDKYGLTKRSIQGWFVDWIKSLGVQLVLLLIFVAATYALLSVDPDLWWLWASLLFTAVTVFMAALAPVLLFPIFFKFEPLPDGELKDRLLSLSERLDTVVQGAYIWQMGDRTVKANAALAGWGKTRRIIISDTLIEKHSVDEIEVVIAHEMGHHVNADIWRGIAVQTILIFVSLWVVNIVIKALSDSFGLNGAVDDFANLPLLALVMTAVGVLALPIANTYSRSRETAADDFAIQTTGMRDEFITAMEKLADQNLSNPNPHWIIETALHSHPSISNRVARARRGA